VPHARPRTYPQGQGQCQGLDHQGQGQGSKFVLEDTSRPRTKAKDNNTAVWNMAEHDKVYAYTERYR